MMKMIDSSSYQVLGDRIVVFKNAIKHPEILISLAEETGWTENNYDGYEDGLIHRYESSVLIAPVSKENIGFLSDLGSAMKAYVDLNHGISEDASRYAPAPWVADVSKYNKGGLASSHTDEDIVEDNGLCSVIVYLNDDYEGGEVGFDDFDVEIKPSAGDVLIFPCHYWHYGAEVLSGYKYMSIFRYNFNN